MECLLDRILPIGSDHPVIGRMVRFHVRDELYENARIDVASLDSLGRLAGDYTKLDYLQPAHGSRALRSVCHGSG
jgi:flavin reductase (DIM6/NTAB) family NADH-FMN oxidoreductase RutF